MITFSRFTKYFVVVAKVGSIRKASEILHVSSSAIDRQILNAEEELNIKLFERMPNGLRLTIAGELLYSNILNWEKQFLHILKQFDELQGLRRGHVKIGLIDAMSEGMVADVTSELLTSYSGLTFSFFTNKNQNVIDMITESKVDFGIVLNPPSSKDLVICSSLNLTLGIAVHPAHPLAHYTEVSPADTISYRLIIPAPPLTINKCIQKIYDKFNLNTQQIIECDDMLMMKSLVRQEIGIGLLSWLDVCNDTSMEGLSFVPLKHQLSSPLKLALCISPQRQLSNAAEITMQLIMDRINSILLVPNLK